MDNRYKSVVEEIRRGDRFLVVSHVNPEGDAIGSLLGLALALKDSGKDVTAYLEDKIPDNLTFLPGIDMIVDDTDWARGFDIIFAVDCGQADRLGKRFVNGNRCAKIINIDHHATNDLFGDINIVDPKASATGEMIYDLLKAASIEVTKDIAVNLYVAIHTDTGSFRYSSTTPAALMKAGELVRMGAEPWHISQLLYENYPAKRFKLLGRVLDTLEISDDGRIASMFVTLDMLREFDAERSLVDGFINYARAIQGVEIAVLFRESGNGRYKVSFRSKGSADVATIAQMFGGGGHVNAAGCNVDGSLEEIKAMIMKAAAGALGCGV